MGIFVKPINRILELERENARLRALVGEPEAPPEPDMEQPEMEQAPPDTLIQTTDDLKIAVGLMAEVLL